MALERVGYRRLYDAIGCSLADRDELRIGFHIGSDLQAEVYIGPRPTFGIFVARSDRYIVLGEQSVMLKGEYQKDASKSSYPRHFFTEISCSKEVKVPEEVASAFHAREPGGQEPLLRLAEKESDRFRSVTDLVAGTIGLRFHRQFVIELINENFFALLNEADYAWEQFGRGLECLDAITLNPEGVALLEAMLPAIGQASGEVQSFAADALNWLMRAWAARDSVGEFAALFIALEMVLSGYTTGLLEQQRRCADSVRGLIREHGDGQREELLAFFNRLIERERPSLQSRFALLARSAKMPGWEADIAAFGRFNSIRNGLLHRGEQKVSLQVPVEDDVRQLKDMAERYVSYALFGDGAVYQSTWRKRPKPTQENTDA